MEASPNAKSNSGGKKDSVSSDEEAYKARLLESKIMRKKAEEDAQLLANRITLLQIEEKKALKKIEDTRKKAKEIMDLKARNAEMQRQKDELRRQREEEEYKKMQGNKMSKQNSRENAETNRNSLMMKLRNEVDEMRKTKKDSKQMFHISKDEERMKNAQTVKAVKDQHKDLEYKKMRIMEDTKMKARMEYEGKIKQEVMMKEQTEQKIADLERQEMQLIQRLQTTQTLQREAFDTLEKALGSNNQGNSTPNGLAISTANTSANPAPPQIQK